MFRSHARGRVIKCIANPADKIISAANDFYRHLLFIPVVYVEWKTKHMSKPKMIYVFLTCKSASNELSVLLSGTNNLATRSKIYVEVTLRIISFLSYRRIMRDNCDVYSIPYLDCTAPVGWKFVLYISLRRIFDNLISVWRNGEDWKQKDSKFLSKDLWMQRIYRHLFNKLWRLCYAAV